MKTGVYRALFCLVLAASLLLAPSAHAMVMVKNYTRYTGAYVAPLEYIKGNDAAPDFDDSEKSDGRTWYTGWKSIFNIFR